MTYICLHVVHTVHACTYIYFVFKSPLNMTLFCDFRTRNTRGTLETQTMRRTREATRPTVVEVPRKKIMTHLREQCRRHQATTTRRHSMTATSRVTSHLIGPITARLTLTWRKCRAMAGEGTSRQAAWLWRMRSLSELGIHRGRCDRKLQLFTRNTRNNNNHKLRKILPILTCQNTTTVSTARKIRMWRHMGDVRSTTFSTISLNSASVTSPFQAGQAWRHRVVMTSTHDQTEKAQLPAVISWTIMCLLARMCTQDRKCRQMCLYNLWKLYTHVHKNCIINFIRVAV